MKIIADANIPFIKGVLEPYAEVHYLRGRDITAKVAKDADALLVRTRTRCDAALLEGSAVRFIATATIGTDHIDISWCEARGIKVTSAAGSNAGGVLQWVAAVLSLLSSEEGWRPGDKTLGIVGVGNVGSLIRRYCRAWGFRVLCSDPPRERTEGLGPADGFFPFEELAARSDIVTFHTPLTTTGDFPSKYLGGKEFFDILKPGATVINSSRGGVVDETAMLAASKGKKLKYCIDTWEGEPDINRLLLSGALVSTPHIAGYSAQGKANASAMVVATLAEYFDLPLTRWYPAEVNPVPRKDIGWDEMSATITDYCDIRGETRQLKDHPGEFESLRERYLYRQEYF